VFFRFDSSEVDTTGQQALNANAEIMKKYPDVGNHRRRAQR
jgi:outer membrane protein OmpA-like peptidoglycan-associated protein